MSEWLFFFFFITVNAQTFLTCIKSINIRWTRHSGVFVLNRLLNRSVEIEVYLLLSQIMKNILFTVAIRIKNFRR